MKKKVTSNLQEFFENIYTRLKESTGKSLHKSRRTFICDYITGLNQSRSVHSSEIAAHMDTSAKIDSDIRKIERFYKDYNLDYETVAFLIAFCLPKGKVKISMDRTEWKFGTTWHNILAITVNSGNVGLPIWVEVLDKSRGISNTAEREAILKKVIQILGVERINGFFADREFIGQDWVSYLLSTQIPFYIRLRNNQKFIHEGEEYQIHLKVQTPKYSKNAKKLNQAKVAFSKKQKANFTKTCLLDNVFIFNTWLSLAISVTNDETDIIAILTNTKAKGAIKKYHKRWTIEVLFQSLKKRGYDIESTHIQDNKRIRKLFIMCGLAFTFTYALGNYVHHFIKRIPRRNHNYFANSIFKTGLKFFREAIKLNQCIKHIFNELLRLANQRFEDFLTFSNIVG